MPAIPKPKRERSESRKAFAREQGCVIYSSRHSEGPVEAHHVKPKGGGIMGGKVSDRRTVGLCWHHHRVVENAPEYYRAALEDEIVRLNRAYDEQQRRLPAKRERKVRVKADRYFVLHSECGLKHVIRKGYFYCSKLRIQCRAPAG